MLRLGRHTFADDQLLTMAIINRTPDSFYDKGATWNDTAAQDRAQQVVEQGADIIDIGGVKAAPGTEVSTTEELRRVLPIITHIRTHHPDTVISIDTWRATVADEACAAGAELINDTWAGHDPRLLDVAAQHHAALICTHTGNLPPRTRPHRVDYPDPITDILTHTLTLARRAEQAGVHPESILLDPTHDFGKNTWHSLEITRRLNELTATGRPVLVSLSNKDFIGETLDLPVDQRLIGTLATTAICAWHGARVFRVHDIPATRQVLDMIAAINGTQPPARTTRGLA